MRICRYFGLFVAVLLNAQTSCKNEPPKPDDAARPSPSGGTSTQTAAGNVAPTVSGSAASSARGDVSSFVGSWTGSFEAKKGAIVLPKGVKDTAPSKDDGKVAVGQGTVIVNVAPTGEVTGTSKGALGDAKLTGTVEGSMLRASVFPEDPTAANAMTGVLVGELKGGTIQGVIRVAGPDATVVREASIELKKK